jgi:hypothetical protein
MSEFTEQNLMPNKFTSESWVVLTPIEQRIKSKIELIGKPLKDWNITINYGIKTGLNEAFIIDGKTKDELIKKSPKNAEVIRPILRGRDIKRYQADFADLWLIATFPSLNYNIDDYPAIKEYLLSFGHDRLKQTGESGARKKTNNQWFETQDSISYWDDFSKQKIVWADLARTGNAFTYDNTGAIVLNTCYILTTMTNDEREVKYLLALLNSKLILFYMNLISSKLDETGWRWFKQFVEILPIANALDDSDFTYYVDTIMSLPTNTLEDKINQMVFDIYGLTEEEISFIEQVL